MDGDVIKDHYDFSKGVRGKFFRADAVFKEPVYLDDEVQTWLANCADSKGIDLSALVNSLLKKEIEIIEAVR